MKARVSQSSHARQGVLHAQLCAGRGVRHDRSVTTISSRLRSIARTAATVPADSSNRAWSIAWRTIVLVLGSAAAIALLCLAFAGIYVGLPHLIVEGTMSGQCHSTPAFDCFRAIADARQAVLFSAGGLIAIVGLYFTYRKWRLEADNTRLAVLEDERAGDRHVREADQLELTRIMDALGLLDSADAAKRTAAISLLIDYAQTTPELRHTKLIIAVLKAIVVRDERTGRPEVDGQYSDERLSMSDNAQEALLGILAISSRRDIDVELTGITFTDLRAEGTTWTRIKLLNVSFVGCDLAGAKFHGEEAELRLLTRVRFENCRLGGADFSRTRLVEGGFHFRGERTHRESMDGSIFQGAVLKDVEIEGLMFASGQIFSGALLEKAKIERGFFMLDAFIGSRLLDVEFEYMRRSRQRFVDTKGALHVPLGTVTVDQVVDVITLNDHDRRRRDSGFPAGDSRTPEPTPTDESPT